MILVDTSVWIDHLRTNNRAFASLLDAGAVLTHPFVISELALGNIRQREAVLAALSDLPQTSIATDAELFTLVGQMHCSGAA